jgi:hypothetical protein
MVLMKLSAWSMMRVIPLRQSKMAFPNYKKVAKRYIRARYTYGDMDPDASGEATTPRRIPKDFKFSPKAIKPLARANWSLSMSMGHLLSAITRINKLKSVSVSPDGLLGGDGYAQNLAEMRKKLGVALEILSSITDTLYDEIQAPHWQPIIEDELPDMEQEIVEDIIQETEEIKADPEGFVSEQQQDPSGDPS